MVITVPNAHLGAEASVVFELDLRGLVSGKIAGFSWSDELRPTSWATITAAEQAEHSQAIHQTDTMTCTYQQAPTNSQSGITRTRDKQRQ